MVSDQCGTGAMMNCWSVCVTAVNQSSPHGVVPRVAMVTESLLLLAGVQPMVLLDTLQLLCNRQQTAPTLQPPWLRVNTPIG